MKRLNISSHYILMLKVTKVILKAELKPLTKKDKEFIDNTFNEWSRMVRIVNSYVKHVYLLNLVYNNGSIDYDPSLRRRTYEFIDNVTEGYKIKPQYTLLKQRGLADIAYDNAKTALEKRSLPDLKGLENTLLIRMSKRPLPANRKSITNRFYEREATILHDGTNFVLRIGRENSRNGNARFVISIKAINNKDRFNMLVDAIDGNNGVTIGDPCIIVRKVKGNKCRYFLHVSVSKNVDVKKLEESILNKDTIRIVGVDIGVTRLATLFCIEVNKQNNTFRLINAESIDGKQFIDALTKYEKEKRRLQSAIAKNNCKKSSYAILNRKGESERVDLRRQIIGYICNRVIRFARENDADVIVIEDLKGLNKRLRELKRIKKELGRLYNAIGKEGIKAIDSKIKETKDKTLRTLLEEIKCSSSNKKEKALKLIVKHRKRVGKQQLLLSFLAYDKFKEELETEALWNNILVERVKPAYTSQKCVRCGSTSKVNRLTQRRFKCNKCNWEMNADYNASLNIALRYVKRLGINVVRVSNSNTTNNNNNNSNNTTSNNNNNSKQGKGNSTMTITSAVTPLHASINAGSSVGSVIGPMPSMQGNPIALGEGSSSLVEGVSESAIGAISPCDFGELHSRRGNGG